VTLVTHNHHFGHPRGVMVYWWTLVDKLEPAKSEQRVDFSDSDRDMSVKLYATGSCGEDKCLLRFSTKQFSLPVRATLIPD
jgi:hypothetical protein